MKRVNFLLYLFLPITSLYALPQGEQITHGNADFQRTENTLTIRPSNNAIIEYSSFNIAKNETVHFAQNKSTDRVLNRVNGFNPSYIDGHLTSNGAVYLVNQAGIFFGNTAVVNVGMLFAAAAKISNGDFLNNINHFSDVSSKIVNEGSINGSKLGFIATEIINKGLIKASDGYVALSTNDRFFLAEKTEDIFIDITHFSYGKIENSGTITAEKDLVFIGAQDVYALASSKLKGQILALNARRNLNVSGDIIAQKEATGGNIYLLADKINVTGANINANGTKGGGNILIGGDFKGQGTIPQSYTTYLDTATQINANALNRGNGGKIIIWSQYLTTCGAQISATGGYYSGNGGFVETSSLQNLNVDGCNVDLFAPKGHYGQWLLDPSNIFISSIDGNATLNDVNAFDKPDKGSEGSTVNANLLNGASADILLEAKNNIVFLEGSNLSLTHNLTAYAGGSIRVLSPITTTKTMTFVANCSSTTQSGNGSITISKPITTNNNVSLTIDGGTGNISIEDALTCTNGDIDLGIAQGSGEIIITKTLRATTGNITILASNGSSNININDPITAGSNITIASNVVDGDININDVIASNFGTVRVEKDNNNGSININGPITANEIDIRWFTSGSGSINMSNQLTSNTTCYIGTSDNTNDVDITISGNIVTGTGFFFENAGSGSLTVNITSSSGDGINSIQSVLDAILGNPTNTYLKLLGQVFDEQIHISKNNLHIEKFAIGTSYPLITQGIILDNDVNNLSLQKLNLDNNIPNSYILDLNSHTLTNLTITNCNFQSSTVNGIGNGSIAGNLNIEIQTTMGCSGDYALNFNCQPNTIISIANLEIDSLKGEINISGSNNCFFSMQDSQLANNLVSCLTLSDFSNVILTNNTFNSNNDTAIYLSDVLNTQITGNTINDSNAGIYITGTTPTGYILKNDFLNNTNYAINVDTSGDPLDVSGNWFGDINQPTSPTVQGNVTFSSWLGVSSGAIPLTWYTNSTIGTAPRRNIGDTISNASSGDIINILTGSYNENVVINKQLNIYFPSDGMCTLNNVMATAPVSLNGNCQATSAPTSFIFFEPVVVIDNLKLLATSNAIEANATIIFNNTLNARWYPADKTGGCNITLAANKLNVNNFVGGYVPFNIIDVSTIPCPNITNKQYYIGYNVIISACAFPWPTSPKNPSNAMNSNFGTMKIISSNAEIQNIINDAQKRYLEKLQKEKQKNEKKSDK